MQHLEFTIIIFTIVFLSFIIFPAIYMRMTDKQIALLDKKSLLNDWRFLMPCLIYTILLGFRYDYAFDWYQYQQTFLYLLRGELYRETTEVGYLAINWILGKLSFNYYSIFCLKDLFGYFLFVIYVKKIAKLGYLYCH